MCLCLYISQTPHNQLSGTELGLPLLSSYQVDWDGQDASLRASGPHSRPGDRLTLMSLDEMRLTEGPATGG